LVLIAEASIDGSTPAASNPETQHGNDDNPSSHGDMDIEKGVAPNATTTELQQDAFRDPNIVDWDGPDDPENPLNWTKRKKVNATVSIALITLLT
jgi:hypothetical protein